MRFEGWLVPSFRAALHAPSAAGYVVTVFAVWVVLFERADHAVLAQHVLARRVGERGTQEVAGSHWGVRGVPGEGESRRACGQWRVDGALEPGIRAIVRCQADPSVRGARRQIGGGECTVPAARVATSRDIRIGYLSDRDAERELLAIDTTDHGAGARMARDRRDARAAQPCAQPQQAPEPLSHRLEDSLNS